MVCTSARNAGGPWFDSRSRHDRLLYANSVCLYIYYINNDIWIFTLFNYRDRFRYTHQADLT